MSNLIPKIKADIKAIEDTVNSAMSKEEVYDKLIKAYNLHKDIIALYEDQTMEIDTSTTKEEVEALEARLRDSEEQVRVLEAWKDGANLEGEQLKTQLTITRATLESRDKLIEDYKTVFDHILQSSSAAISELTNLQTIVNPNGAENI